MFRSQSPVSTSGPKDQFCASKYAGQRVVVVQDHGSHYGGDMALCQLLKARSGGLRFMCLLWGHGRGWRPATCVVAEEPATV